jgi:hypothetical protein
VLQDVLLHQSFHDQLDEPTVTFCADFGLKESLMPIQMSSPSPRAAYQLVSIRTFVSSRR